MTKEEFIKEFTELTKVLDSKFVVFYKDLDSGNQFTAFDKKIDAEHAIANFEKLGYTNIRTNYKRNSWKSKL